jgi:glutamate--cysteine ligase
MTAQPSSSGQTVTDRRQLIEHLESGCKPAADWRIGTEHEKFVFHLDTLRPVAYEGASGIRALLEAMMARFGWRPILEAGNPIALVHDDTTACISLEPGGQLELSGAPLETIHQTCAEVHRHLRQVREVAEELRLGMLGLGFQPKWRREDIPWMPKGRYRIMREYMPRRGTLGLDMMLRTCTVQVNLDFASEADMVEKFRVSLALQPVATALFAASPFIEGKPAGFQSYRSHIWRHTDPDRTGMLPFVFDDGFGFERYVDYVLDVPMYFVYRDGRYIDASGQSFRDFLAGRLPALPGELPTMGDWTDHLTTLFPEVRLKKYLEMRGADGGPWERLCALPALWGGLLYDPAALTAAAALVRDWTGEEMQRLRDEVPRLGLRTPFRGGTLRDVARDVLAVARDGLRTRARADECGDNEAHFLAALSEIAETGRSPADRLLDEYAGKWHGQVDPIFVEHAY